MHSLSVVLSLMLSGVEQLFPLIPEKSREEVGVTGGNYQPPKIYYALDDPRTRLWARLKAVCDLDRRSVSYWRRRESHFRRRIKWRPLMQFTAVAHCTIPPES